MERVYDVRDRAGTDGGICMITKIIRKMYDALRNIFIANDVLNPDDQVDARYLIQTSLGNFSADRYLPCSYGVEFARQCEDGIILSVYLNDSNIIIHDFGSNVTIADFDNEIARRHANIKTSEKQNLLPKISTVDNIYS